MRCVFVGTPGFLGRVEGSTRCAFWAEDPQGHGFDPGQLVAVDLACTPSAAAAGVIGWDEVQVDDCFTGPNGAVAGTTIGPRWPELRMSGAVYLEQRFVVSLPAELRPACPPVGGSGRVYECLTTVYWPHVDDLRAGTRYAGHHAEIVEERGSLAHVAIWAPGSSGASTTPAAWMWIDLASPNQCDAGPDSLTTIGVGDAPKQGALFLISGHLNQQQKETPREPQASSRHPSYRQPATDAPRRRQDIGQPRRAPHHHPGRGGARTEAAAVRR